MSVRSRYSTALFRCPFGRFYSTALFVKACVAVLVVDQDPSSFNSFLTELRHVLNSGCGGIEAIATAKELP